VSPWTDDLYAVGAPGRSERRSHEHGPNWAQPFDLQFALTLSQCHALAQALRIAMRQVSL
jgi:hypothetical protein